MKIFALLLLVSLSAEANEITAKDFERCGHYIDAKAKQLNAGDLGAGAKKGRQRRANRRAKASPEAVAAIRWYREEFAKLKLDFDRTKAFREGGPMHMTRFIAGSTEPCKELDALIEIHCQACAGKSPTEKCGPECVDQSFMEDYELFQSAYAARDPACAKPEGSPGVGEHLIYTGSPTKSPSLGIETFGGPGNSDLQKIQKNLNTAPVK